MRIIATMAVYNEEDMIRQCLASLQTVGGLSEIHVFDGAWKHFDTGFASTDNTRSICEEFVNAEVPVVWHAGSQWQSQEQKRTAGFQEVGATIWDYVMIVDADERFEGGFDTHLDQSAYCLYTKCVGPNDMPGLRGVWPNGDYSTHWIPAIRVFRWHPTLKCLWPGGYQVDGKLIEVYKPDRNAYGGYSSRIPQLDWPRFTHHGADRSPEKLAVKKAYYDRIHPERAERQRRYSE